MGSGGDAATLVQLRCPSHAVGASFLDKSFTGLHALMIEDFAVDQSMPPFDRRKAFWRPGCHRRHWCPATGPSNRVPGTRCFDRARVSAVPLIHSSARRGWTANVACCVRWAHESAQGNQQLTTGYRRRARLWWYRGLRRVRCPSSASRRAQAGSADLGSHTFLWGRIP